MKEIYRPKVSIIIPVYNGANYLKEAIDSALSQTYENIEVIIVNDGSSDGGKTHKIAMSYGDRVRYFSKENGGVATALNFGIEKMSGDYFSWLSHDDVYHHNKIETQIGYLMRLKNKDTILYGGYELINEVSEKTGAVNPATLYSVEKLNIPLFPILRGIINGCTLLVPKKCFQLIGLFDPSLKTTQDYALWFSIFRKFEIKFHHELLVKTRIHDDRGTFKIPNHLDECNSLWIGFLNSLTEKEMNLMEGNPYSFYKKTEKFLEDTPYKEAKNHSSELAESYFQSIFVSVIIPFHNRVELTKEAINSVLKQTYKHFEILLIDDGSDENIDDIIHLVNNNKKIKYYKQNNSGVSSARNFGISVSRGDYVSFLDSDDLFVEDKIEKQLRIMLASEKVISHTSYDVISKSGEFVRHVDTSVFSGYVFPKIIASCCVATPTVMAKREIFVHRKFIENFKVGEDVCMWIDISLENEFQGIKEALTRVRVDEKSSAYNLEKQKTGLLNIINFVTGDNKFSLKNVNEINGCLCLLTKDLSKMYYLTSDITQYFEFSNNMFEYLPSTNNNDKKQNVEVAQVETAEKVNSLTYRLLKSLKREGLVCTLKKVFYKLKAI